MAISLSKNQSISLNKTAGTDLSKITLGLGWDPVKASGFFSKLLGSSDTAVDLDASCILLNANYGLVDVVWFRQLQSQDGAVQHSGDNRTGDGDGDDESILVNLDALAASVTYLVFTVNSFRGQTFDAIERAYCRILNNENGQELARFNLAEKGNHTGIVMAYLFRDPNGWQFKALGEATRGRTVDDLITLAIQAIHE